MKCDLTPQQIAKRLTLCDEGLRALTLSYKGEGVYDIKPLLIVIDKQKPDPTLEVAFTKDMLYYQLFGSGVFKIAPWEYPQTIKLDCLGTKLYGWFLNNPDVARGIKLELKQRPMLWFNMAIFKEVRYDQDHDLFD